MKTIISFLLAILFSLTTTSSFAGPYKTVKDWSVYCSDTLICLMSSQLNNENLYSLEIERSPEANAQLSIHFSIAGSINEESDIILSIPQELEELSLSVQDGEFINHKWVFSNSDIFNKLMPAMKAGSKLLVHMETSNGQVSVPVSLLGSSAIMLYVDEVQDRVGKQDALYAKGDAPATGRKTRVKELTSQNDLPNAVSNLWGTKTDRCNEDDRDLITDLGGIAVALGEPDESILYVLPCGGSGAYNALYTAYEYFTYDQSARSLSFPIMTDVGPSVMDTIFNMGWDDSTSRLSAYYKGRGLGDCGSSHIWQWSSDGPQGNFVLIEERAKGECDGKYDDWPLIWPIQ